MENNQGQTASTLLLQTKLKNDFKLNNQQIELLLKHTKAENFQKNSLLLNENTIETKIRFLNTGLVRAYMQHNQQQPLSQWYSKEAHFACSMQSFLDQTPSQYSLEAVEDTEILYIEYNQIQEILKADSSLNSLMNTLVSNYLHTHTICMPC